MLDPSIRATVSLWPTSSKRIMRAGILNFQGAKARADEPKAKESPSCLSGSWSEICASYALAPSNQRFRFDDLSLGI